MPYMDDVIHHSCWLYHHVDSLTNFAGEISMSVGSVQALAAVIHHLSFLCFSIFSIAITFGSITTFLALNNQFPLDLPSMSQIIIDMNEPREHLSPFLPS